MRDAVPDLEARRSTSYDEQGPGEVGSNEARDPAPTASLPRHTDVSREQIRRALLDSRRFACFVTPRRLDAARVKISASVRSLRLPYRTWYDESAWTLYAYVPIAIAGECAAMPSPHEWDELEAVFELAHHVRTHIAMIRAGAGK